MIQTAGESREATVSNPRGHHSRPVTREDLRDKFVTLLADAPGPVPGGSAGRRGELTRCFDALAAVADCADCAALPLPSPER
ncbi:hypothetical protein ACFQY7_16660 [Actinomadura luteofluorescens]|uniref:hypothetical protein n=1 Tax=Actinomadura luteofluorescens TaxID=46163 RepID=UPI00363A384A